MAFHRYPQLIPQFCIIDGFGPSLRCYRSFTLAMGRSPGFGSTPSNSSPYSDSLSLRLRQVTWLNLATERKSPAHSSIGTPSLRQVGAPTVCRHAVSGTFHSPPGVLFTFPSRYWFTIGHHRYVALEDGPPRFPRGFTCPVVLRNSSGRSAVFRVQGCHLLWRPVPGTFC